jgi:hypothetical protein
MKHIDEHILELYVLGSEEVRKQRAAIERHLGQCPGCSSIVEEMRRYYEDADLEYDQHPRESSTPDLALKKRETDLNPLFTAVSMPVAQRTRRGMERFGWYVRQHPVRSVVGGFMTLGVFALAASLAVNMVFKNRALVSYNYNPGANTLEGLNGRDEVLWSKPSEDVKSIVEGEHVHQYRKTILTDLEGSGSNEVITTIPIWDEQNSVYEAGLRVFEADGTIRFQRDFARPVHYMNRQYPPLFRGEALLALNASHSNAKELFVAVNNNRSPSFLARFDDQGELLGEYWHFGFLPKISELAMEPGRRPFVILYGCNDTEDSTNRTFAAIVIIEADKLRGKTECSATRGFGYPASEAEVFYIRLPRTDISDALEATEGVIYRMPGDSTEARFYVSSTNQPGLEYVFSNTMVIRDVMPYTGFETVHAKLRSEGKVHSRLGPEYLERLKRGVRYWDGKEWRKEVTRVKHGP